MGRYLISVACAVLLFAVAEIAQLCLCANSSIPSSPCVERERRALLEFKASLTDPSNRLSSWHGVHCCQWEGVGCDNLTGHVVKLDLITPYSACNRRSQQFTVSNILHSRYFREMGECDDLDNDNQHLEAANVNPSLLQLEYLTYLDLSGNSFNYSPIPTFIGSMQRLNYLSLFDGGFSGRIPSSLGNLTNLHFLDLSWNTGLTNNDINWISGLQSLEHLEMGLVYLGSNAHKLFQVNLTNAPQLQVLGLALTGLTVFDLDALFKNMTSLVHLDLSNNNLTSVPSWFGKFDKLEYLDLSDCWLHNPIPDAFRNLTSIDSLYLSGNLFTSVPSWFVELKTLLYLELSGNELTSMECPLSSILRNMCHLKMLDFSGNKLQEESIGRNELSACIRYDLESLDLSDNKFNTHLPSWFNQLENMKYLYLQNNLFYGPILFSFRKIPKLKVLYLSNNKFEGVLSNNSLGQLVNLMVLDLSNNSLSGTIPQSFGQLINLKSLGLSNNHFNGTVLQSIGQLINLQCLHLSNNCFNGFIPQNFGQLVNLFSLDLSRNKLHGSIPFEFGQFVSLEELDLSSNNLDGVITWGRKWFSIMPNLSSLDLSDNQISGSLPDYLGHIVPNIWHLRLGNNLINGSIPNSLCQTKLVSLDISNNRLSGEIPNCWKDNNDLDWDEINLSSNKLSGVFPSSLGNLSRLSWLHLNNNSLQGELPVYVKNLKQLLILDVGENELSGKIPSWTATTFPLLQVLRLRRNKLSGSIPSQLCQLSFLKILDLSRNNFQGSIPSCIGNLRGMTLNKSSEKSFIELTPTMSTGVAETPMERWSTEHVKQVMKGMELDYTKNLVLVVNMDLSENRLDGVIPEGITLLNGLHGLNLSNNHLKAGIPKMIGDMKSLESFDVSNNQLSGTIPNSMSTLTSLSRLNLSHNNFSGPIPTDYQFSTYEPSSYADNPYLCGLPLPNKCPGDNSSRQAPTDRGFEDEDGKKSKLEKWLFYFVVAVGFASGFWGVIGVLLFKKSWRHAYFRWVEDAADMIYVATAVNLSKLKKHVVRNSATIHG